MINQQYTVNIEKNIFDVKNFLDIDYVDKIELDLINIPRDWWFIHMRPINVNFDTRSIRYSDDLTNDVEFIKDKDYNISWFNNGNFGYIFNQISSIDHYKTCSCICCKLHEYFNSDEIKSEFSKIVGEKITTLNETFVSRYDHGDYLSIHHDKQKGDYAFVFQLTKKWNPSHGGLLNFYDSSISEIYKAVNPIFNSLIIFKIKDVNITDHFVSMNVGKTSRYAFTGWFSA